MVKLIELIPPRPDIPVQTFHDHWRHPHGTLAMNSRPVRRYLQNHRIDSPMVGPNGTAYEGVAEVWFDSMEAIEGIARDPFIIEHVFPDEERFVDRANLVVFTASEEVLATAPKGGPGLYDDDWSDNNRPLAIKLLQFVSTDGTERWDSDDDADLGQRIGALRQVRNRPIGDSRPFLGMRELWWPTLTSFEQGVARDSDAWRRITTRPASSFLFLAQSERLI